MCKKKRKEKMVQIVRLCKLQKKNNWLGRVLPLGLKTCRLRVKSAMRRLAAEEGKGPYHPLNSPLREINREREGIVQPHHRP